MPLRIQRAWGECAPSICPRGYLVVLVAARSTRKLELLQPLEKELANTEALTNESREMWAIAGGRRCVTIRRGPLIS